jgi:hypothetical protein
LNADNLFLQQLVILISGYQIRQLLAIKYPVAGNQIPLSAEYQTTSFWLSI